MEDWICEYSHYTHEMDLSTETLMIFRMVNNAAIVCPPQSIHETSIERWDQVMQVNTRSVYLGCKLATTVMLKQEVHESGDRGWIINIGSIAGVVGCGSVRMYQVLFMGSERDLLKTSR